MAETMKAGVLAGSQKIVVQDVPVPELKPGGLEIEVKACGVCGSDIHMWKTGKGWAEQDGEFHMGHEFCGVVTNPGSSSFKVGDRVTFWANLYCGECDMCRAGWNTCAALWTVPITSALFATAVMRKNLWAGHATPINFRIPFRMWRQALSTR